MDLEMVVAESGGFGSDGGKGLSKPWKIVNGGERWWIWKQERWI